MARENPDTAQIAVMVMGAAILGGVFYLLLRNDPSVPKPTGSQVPEKAPPPPVAPPVVTVQTTYAVPMSDNPFALRVGDTVAIVPTVPGGDWGRPVVSGDAAGLVQTAQLTSLGPQPDGAFVFRADGPGIATISYGYSTPSGTENHSQTVTVIP